MRSYWFVVTILCSTLPAAANESRSVSFSNLSLDTGSSAAPSPSKISQRAAESHSRPLATKEVPPVEPKEAAGPTIVSPGSRPPAPLERPLWPLLGGAGVLISAAALAARRRARRQANDALAVAAHELKSPLTALESYLALMEHDGKSGAAADTRAWLEDVAHMRSTAAHLRRTIGDILEMTRLDDARVKIDAQALDLAEAARQTTAAFQALASEANIKIELCAAPAPAWGDPTRVRRILDNLVSNALRHAPDGGEVKVSTGSDAAGRAWCSVVDDGGGVPPAQRARLFSRFAHLSPPLRGELGTGLGLYIGRTLARAQGGALEYEPMPAVRGSRFRLTLPRARRA